MTLSPELPPCTVGIPHHCFTTREDCLRLSFLPLSKMVQSWFVKVVGNASKCRYYAIRDCQIFASPLWLSPPCTVGFTILKILSFPALPQDGAVKVWPSPKLRTPPLLRTITTPARHPGIWCPLSRCRFSV